MNPEVMPLRPVPVDPQPLPKIRQVLPAQHAGEQKVRQSQEQYEVEKHLVEDVHGGES